jgi:hypothetical protein
VGYRVKRKVYKLVFADEEMAGLEVVARSMTTGQLIELNGKDSGHGAQSDAFASALVSWNLEDEDGAPVPATLEGIRSLEVDFTLKIMNAWLDAVNGVSAPLDPSSSGGLPSVVGSIPMETLSASLAS